MSNWHIIRLTVRAIVFLIVAVLSGLIVAPNAQAQVPGGQISILRPLTWQPLSFPL
jgi:hypothetical protein